MLEVRRYIYNAYFYLFNHVLNIVNDIDNQNR